jgi:hypothetical protein
MPLKRSLVDLLQVLLAACLGIAIILTSGIEEASAMPKSERVRLYGKEISSHLTRNELPALSRALRKAIEDPKLVRESRAPPVYAQRLPSSIFRDVSYDEEREEVRVGEWILVEDADGLFWQYRLLPPNPPQIGLMFVARLVHPKEGWSVPKLDFIRIR